MWVDRDGESLSQVIDSFQTNKSYKYRHITYMLLVIMEVNWELESKLKRIIEVLRIKYWKVKKSSPHTKIIQRYIYPRIRNRFNIMEEHDFLNSDSDSDSKSLCYISTSFILNLFEIWVTVISHLNKIKKL